jgi:hypothetical protein
MSGWYDVLNMLMRLSEASSLDAGFCDRDVYERLQLTFGSYQPGEKVGLDSLALIVSKQGNIL